MATNPQRVQAIANALINAIATPAQINRIGQGLAHQPPPFTGNYDALSNAEKMAFILAQLRQIVLFPIKQKDASDAARATPVPDPALVDTEFAETP